MAPRHRPADHEIPDGMSLLYADLPEPPDPPADRSRVELVLGGIAAISATVVGARIASGLLRSTTAADRRVAAPRESESVTGFTGVERVVESDSPIARLDDIPVVEYAPIADGDEARSVIDSVPDPDPLPGTGTQPKPMPVVSGPPDPGAAAPVPTTTVPATTVPPTSVPVTTVPTTTVPSTTPPTTVASTTSPPTTTSPTTTAPPALVEPPAEVHALVLTAGFNMTSQMARTIDAVGYEGWVDMQLDPSTTPDPVVDAVVVDFDLLDADPEHLRANDLGPVALSQTRWAGFARSLVGERQVEEIMVDLWREFFAVHAPEADLVGLEQVIRTHALDSYAALLEAVLGSSAMRSAFMLDEHPSVDQILDSNLARTLLERFAYGDPDAFDETAVETAAAAIAADRNGYLTALVAEPHVASHIAGVLARQVLGDAVSDEVVAAAAMTFAGSGGSIRDVVRRLLLSGVGVADSSRVRSGLGWLTASLRALGAEVMIGGPWNPDDAASLPGALRLLGAEPGTGALRADEAWLTPTAVGSRWGIARSLAGGELADVVLVPTEPSAATSASELVADLARSCGALVNEVEHDAVLHYLSLDGDDPAPALDGAALADVQGLVLSFPSFQRRDGGRQ